MLEKCLDLYVQGQVGECVGTLTLNKISKFESDSYSTVGTVLVPDCSFTFTCTRYSTPVFFRVQLLVLVQENK